MSTKAVYEDDKHIFTRLAQDFHELVTNKEVLKGSLEDFLNNVIDEITLGIIFNTHRKHKTNSYEVEVEEDNDDNNEDNSNFDSLFDCDKKKSYECPCPICGRTVGAVLFAPHLNKCMGGGRTTTITTRRSASKNNNIKDQDSTSYSGVTSDDENDIDWTSGSKRGKKKKNNGNKKLRGGAKKTTEIKTKTKPYEIEDGTGNYIELIQDHSNSSLPADLLTNNSGMIKKKSRSKKNKRYRSSPSSSKSAD